jgi:hypothetical protein
MARRLHNWSYRDVTNFLRDKGFTCHKEPGGSHQAWIKRGHSHGLDIIVGVNFTHTSYPVGSLKRMIRQSGMEAKEWVKEGRS